MQAHQILIQAVLLPATLGNVLFSYQLGVKRPGWMVPSMAAAVASLAVLLASAVGGLRGPWLWAVACFCIVYPPVLIAAWRKAAREWPRDEESPAPIKRPPSTPAVSLEAENGHAVLVHGGGLRRPLARSGQPADALLPGWSVAAIHNEFPPLVVVSLAHADGQTARWIVDSQDELHDEPVTQLPATVRDALRAGVRRLQDIRDRGEAGLAAWNAVPRATRLELPADSQARVQPGEEGLTAMAGGQEHGPALPVRSDAMLLSVSLPTGIELPILKAGAVLQQADFLPGWSAESLYCDFAPFYLLELRHESGLQATWLLDDHLSCIADIKHVSQATRDALCLRAAPVIGRHLDSVLAFAEPGSDPVVDRYVRLSGDARHVLATYCGSKIKRTPTPIGSSAIPSEMPVAAAPGSEATLALRRASAEQAVTTDLHRRTLEAIVDGRFEWPSPVDGSAATLRGIFTWYDYAFFYEFVDRNGLDFVIVASDRNARVVGLVIPAANLILFDDRKPNVLDPNIWLEGNLGGGFWWLLVQQANRFPHEMALRRRTAHARPVNVLLSGSFVHIGHHLWNDLSGFEALCKAVPSEQLPTTMVIGAAETPVELFGPIEALFPAARGRIDRSLDTLDSFVRWTYRQDVWPTRITQEYVSAALRERIMGHFAGTVEAEQARDMLSAWQPSRRGAPVVVFGLRVEDRTLVNLPAFCEAFVSFMAARHPGAIVVFDGYNSRPDAVGSVNLGMVHHLADQPPEEVEAALVASLIERFAGQPITIVGTTGRSIATSLAWCRQADAAFAIWGAGLAKIRWLANLPTMAVTGHWNLVRRSDLNIYHDAAFMEAPALMVFPNPSLVADVHDHKALASGFSQGGRECFMLHTDEVLHEFDALLARALREREHAALLE